MRRRGSLLSLRGEPSSPPEQKPEPKVLVPPTQDPYAETTVILHDSSYKHRYSRPRTSAEELASIVERPERIPAAVLGVCAAQVRAGKERIAIRKTVRMGWLGDAEVMLVHAHTPVDRGRKAWPEELSGMAAGAKEKLARGVVEVPAGYHQGDLFLGGESLEDLEGCLGAVYDGVDAVFGDTPAKKAFVCIRPPGMLRREIGSGWALLRESLCGRSSLRGTGTVWVLLAQQCSHRDRACSERARAESCRHPGL